MKINGWKRRLKILIEICTPESQLLMKLTSLDLDIETGYLFSVSKCLILGVKNVPLLKRKLTDFTRYCDV